MKQEIKEKIIHRGERLFFGFSAFVMCVMIAIVLHLRMDDAPLYPILLSGWVLMLLAFIRSAKPREPSTLNQTNPK